MSGENAEVLLPNSVKLPDDATFLVVWVGPLRPHPTTGHEKDPIVEIIFREIETEKSLGWTSVKSVAATSSPRTEWLPLLFLVHARVGTIWKNKRNIGTIRFSTRRFRGVIDPSDWSFVSGKTVLQDLYVTKGQSWLPTIIDEDMRWPVPGSAFCQTNFVRLPVKSADNLPEPSMTVVPCTAVFHSIFFISDRLAQHILFGDFEGENNHLYDPKLTTFDPDTGRFHLVIHPDMLMQDEWAIAMLIANPRGIPSMRIIRQSSHHHASNDSFELRAHLPFSGEFECTLRGIELQGVNSRSIFMGLDIIGLKTEILIKDFTVRRETRKPQSQEEHDIPPPQQNSHEPAPAPNIPPGQDLTPEFRSASLRDQHSARFKSKKYRSAYFVQGNVKKTPIYESKPQPSRGRYKRLPKDAHPRFSTNPRGTSDTGVPRADGSAQNQIMPMITDELNAGGGPYAERLGLVLSDLAYRGYKIMPYSGSRNPADPGPHFHFPVCDTAPHITSIKFDDGTERPRRIFVYKISNKTYTDIAYIFDFERINRGDISKWILIVRGEITDGAAAPFGDEQMNEFLKKYVQKNAELSKIKNCSIRKVLDQGLTEIALRAKIAQGLSDSEAWCFHHLPNFVQALREQIPYRTKTINSTPQPSEHPKEKTA